MPSFPPLDNGSIIFRKSYACDRVERVLKLLAIVRRVAKSSGRKENLDRLTVDFSLFDGPDSFDLNSFDIIDVALEVEKEFGVAFDEQEEGAKFFTVRSLADHLLSFST